MWKKKCAITGKLWLLAFSYVLMVDYDLKQKGNTPAKLCDAHNALCKEYHTV